MSWCNFMEGATKEAFSAPTSTASTQHNLICGCGGQWMHGEWWMPAVYRSTGLQCLRLPMNLQALAPHRFSAMALAICVQLNKEKWKSEYKCSILLAFEENIWWRTGSTLIWEVRARWTAATDSDIWCHISFQLSYLILSTSSRLHSWYYFPGKTTSILVLISIFTFRTAQTKTTAIW